MNIETLVLGPLETNCYILTINNKCLIIDPADEFQKIKQSIGNKEVIGCLITHFHPDHIGALEEVLTYYDLSLNQVKENIFNYEVIETPGHTNDSKTYYFKKENIMFDGDFIFKDGIGRLDLGGNEEDMKNSIETILKYPKKTILYPGHGEPTTIGDEKNALELF